MNKTSLIISLFVLALIMSNTTIIAQQLSEKERSMLRAVEKLDDDIVKYFPR